uniref:hypothetical protein n=1 Tax=Acetatifactor sp. TaxID=1872090 RepID=UPI004055D7BA
MSRVYIPNKIRIIGALFSIALVITTSIGVTAAYYKAESNVVENQFSVGNVTTELVEEFYQKTDTEFVKTPMVTNTGADSCLVRVRMNVTPESLLEQKVLDAQGNETNQNYLVIEGWSENWTFKNDGYYYYNKVLQPGESTDALFTTVHVNYDEAQNPWVDFDIILYQEAVQSEVVENGQTISGTTAEGRTAIWGLYER